jgi:hypothetical protein
MQHDRQVGRLQDGEERRKVTERYCVEHRGAGVGRDLDDAEPRAIGPLPHELGVEGEASARAHLGGELFQLVGARDDALGR